MNKHALFEHETFRRNRVLKLICDYKQFRGKTILFKIIYLLNYLDSKYLDFKPIRYKYGPYSPVINQDLSILENKGYVNSEMKKGKKVYTPNYDRIENDYPELEFNLELDRNEDLKEYNIIQFCKILRNTKMIELATSIHYLVIYENILYIDDVFNEIDRWKGSKFTEEEKLTAWELLFDNKLLPKEIYKTNQIIRELQNCQKGKLHCFKYQIIIKKILHYLFPGKIVNIQAQKSINKREGIIDLTGRNDDRDGFFNELYTIHMIKCPYILIECKNLSKDLKNQDLSQISSRLCDDLGYFGLLFCRNIENEESIKSKIKNEYKKDVSHKNLIIVIEDKEVIEMILLKCRGEPPDKILRKKLEEIIFNN